MPHTRAVLQSGDSLSANAESLSCRRRLAIFTVVTAAVIVVLTSTYLTQATPFKYNAIVYRISFYVLVIALPFVLHWLLPHLAYSEIRWWPSTVQHWLWAAVFCGGVIACGPVFSALFLPDNTLLGAYYISRAMYLTPANVVLLGLSVIFLAPLAEEVFFRGYVLSQLRRSLGHWMTALMLQSIIFAFAHLKVWHSFGVFLYLFLFGMIFGAWRIKFGSLLPLVIAHVIFNAVAFVPYVVPMYKAAAALYEPRQHIDLVATFPAEDALPELIKYIGHRDDVVSGYAIQVIDQRFHKQAEPYLQELLKSDERRTVSQALFAVQWLQYRNLMSQVTDLVWLADDIEIQLEALLTLHSLANNADEELRRIAQQHPNISVRQAAARLIGRP